MIKYTRLYITQVNLKRINKIPFGNIVYVLVSFISTILNYSIQVLGSLICYHEIFKIISYTF